MLQEYAGINLLLNPRPGHIATRWSEAIAIFSQDATNLKNPLKIVMLSDMLRSQNGDLVLVATSTSEWSLFFRHLHHVT